MSVKFSGNLRLKLGFPVDYLCCLGEGASNSSLSIIISKDINKNFSLPEFQQCSHSISRISYTLNYQ